MEADALGLEGQTDFLELLQFGGYRGLGLGRVVRLPEYRVPVAYRGRLGFSVYEGVGDCLTYAFVGEKATPRKFVEQVPKRQFCNQRTDVVSRREW